MSDFPDRLNEREISETLFSILQVSSIPSNWKPFPATEVVRNLLECSCTHIFYLKRNSRISYSIARRAAMIYVKLNVQVGQVEEECRRPLNSNLTNYEKLQG